MPCKDRNTVARAYTEYRTAIVLLRRILSLRSIDLVICLLCHLRCRTIVSRLGRLRPRPRLHMSLRLRRCIGQKKRLRNSRDKTVQKPDHYHNQVIQTRSHHVEPGGQRERCDTLRARGQEGRVAQPSETESVHAGQFFIRGLSDAFADATIWSRQRDRAAGYILHKVSKHRVSKRPSNWARTARSARRRITENTVNYPPQATVTYREQKWATTSQARTARPRRPWSWTRARRWGCHRVRHARRGCA